MSNSTVQILARVLRVLLIFALLLNVLALFAWFRLRHGQRGKPLRRRRHLSA